MSQIDAAERRVLIGFLHLYLHLRRPEYDGSCEFCRTGGLC
jgi:hypothetical protein